MNIYLCLDTHIFIYTYTHVYLCIRMYVQVYHSFAVGIDSKLANRCEAHPKPFVDHWDTVIHAYHSRDRCSCPQKNKEVLPPRKQT